MSAEKAKYRVLRLSHIHNNLWPEGSEVEYDGVPGSALEPLNDAAKAAKAKATGKVAVANAVKQPGPLNDEGHGDDDALDKLREEYELLFNEKPHHNTKPETLREKIAEKRKDLGV
ncbi:hypothetical protein NAK94_002516 [Klebsiella aerogenes]|uniref:hypothetical protein n=1 Tax=Klebsiella aerogenes TaxID=548 RepID=UPI00063CCCBA|nr:hypothetical protein [Klebsiella aerogenes]EKW3261202.1 hypothetical protein [Klebsiella aerogenes]ELX9632953.1 hypothetical protein [Klebsiella aerogenes]KLF74576.1 hypothetical protein YA38_01855 [Klebsiella aerogenes]HDU5042163.1 hypothetical protein [Klebsiella aerogenes]HEM8060110.1 hypothetical protein [Klebsiella aerogenes]